MKHNILLFTLLLSFQTFVKGFCTKIMNPSNQSKYGDLVRIEGIGSPNRIIYYNDCKQGTKTVLTNYYDCGEKRYGDVQDCTTPVFLTVPFITSDKEWVVYYQGFTSIIDNGIRTYSFSETKDTVEGVPLYELVYNTPVNPNLISTKNYFKEKNGKVLSHHENGVEELIYNFNVNVGDTIVRFTYQPLFNLIVTKIDTVVFNDLKPRKRIHLQCEIENNRIYYWIEGMGGNDAFLYDDICTIFDGPILGLRCFYENGVIIYQDSLVQNCLISKVEDIENIEKIKIFPNPTLNKIIVESNVEIRQICIYNQIGQLMVKKEIEQKEIDISDLPSGIYNMEVILKGSEFSREIRRIIKI